MSFNKICVIGLGYIGLPTATLFASRNVSVLGVDINSSVVDSINRGVPHIVEPDLDALLRIAVEDGLLKATTQIASAEVFIIAVPTPFKENHQPDLRYVRAATEMIAPVLEKGNLIILESTSPVGTTEQIGNWLSELRPDLKMPTTARLGDISLCYCPERVLPGHILRELVSNDRVIGGITANCAEKARDLYQIFVEGKCILTNSRTAELTKLTENAFRDVNIAFANELSLVCERLGINVWDLIALANHHPRVNILQPGPGVGGHCIAVDPWFLVSSAPDLTPLMRTARQVNDNKPLHVIAKIKIAAEQYEKPNIACLGLAFKRDIDDLRESPAVAITEELARQNIGNLYIVEPHIKQLPKSLNHNPQVNLVPLTTALAIADIVVLLVDHRDFAGIDKQSLHGKVVIDTRGILPNLVSNNTICAHSID